MTVKDALCSEFEGLQLKGALIERSLLQADLNDGTQAYNPREHDAKIELATLNILFALWGNIKSYSEGDLSVTFDSDRKAKLLFLARKHKRTDIINLLDDKPTIKAVRKW